MFKRNRIGIAALAVAALLLVVAVVSLAPVFAQDGEGVLGSLTEGLVFWDDAECVVYQAQAVDAVEAEDDAEDEAEGEDVPVTGNPLERASAAALAYTEGGRVTDTEVGDEEGYYEIEVTLPNGRQVDVHLDEDFNVLGDEVDGVTEEDEDVEVLAADEDDDEVGDENESCGLLDEATLSLDDLIAIAEGETGSTVILVELENENGQLVYEAVLENGLEIEVDAHSGDILEVEQAD